MVSDLCTMPSYINCITWYTNQNDRNVNSMMPILNYSIRFLARGLNRKFADASMCTHTHTTRNFIIESKYSMAEVWCPLIHIDTICMTRIPHRCVYHISNFTFINLYRFKHDWKSFGCLKPTRIDLIKASKAERFLKLDKLTTVSSTICHCL